MLTNEYLTGTVVVSSKCHIPYFLISELLPNEEDLKLRPPHCREMVYEHESPLSRHLLHSGFCSSHFWRLVLHLVQPPLDLLRLGFGTRAIFDVFKFEVFDVFGSLSAMVYVCMYVCDKVLWRDVYYSAYGVGEDGRYLGK
jgi:hypothetical protein